MPAIVGGRNIVAAPLVTPLRFGLLSAADELLEGDTHWKAGIMYQPDVCAEAGVTTQNCTDSYTKSPQVTGMETRGADAFTVFAYIRCSPVGNFDEYQAKTTALLTNGEGRAVENTVWTGTALGGDVVRPHLAEDTLTVEGSIIIQTAAVTVTGGAVTPVVAVALLEGALADCYGGEGVIHVPRAALAILHSAGVILQDGQRLRTLGGTRIAAYASNNREGPTDAAATGAQYWFYGTGAVTYRRSEITYTSSLPAALDRSENTMVYIAERTYAFNWDCCHFAQLVNLI